MEEGEDALSIMRVLITSIGVVMTAANDPAKPAAMAVTVPVSCNVPEKVLWRLR